MKLIHLFLSLVFLHTSLAVDRELQFDWDLSANGAPTINFNNANENSELIFAYTYTGTLNATKTLSQTIYGYDCTTATDGTITINGVSSAAGAHSFNVDIIQTTIAGSTTHYSSLNATHAQVQFCVRVNYKWNSDVVNYHETQVTVVVDKTSDHSISNISAEYTAKTQIASNSESDYAVKAYFCDDNRVLTTPGAFSKAMTMQFCVKLDDTVTVSGLYVSDVRSTTISQSGTDPSYIIVDGSTDALTTMTCATGGICNVKTVLMSKFFEATTPNDLSIAGTAVVSFGTARKLIEFRSAQEGDDTEDIFEGLEGSPYSAFVLDVELEPNYQGPDPFILAGTGFVAVALLATYVYRRRSRRAVKETTGMINGKQQIMSANTSTTSSHSSEQRVANIARALQHLDVLDATLDDVESGILKNEPEVAPRVVRKPKKNKHRPPHRQDAWELEVSDIESQSSRSHVRPSPIESTKTPVVYDLRQCKLERKKKQVRATESFGTETDYETAVEREEISQPSSSEQETDFESAQESDLDEELRMPTVFQLRR